MRTHHKTAIAAGCFLSACLFGQSSSTMPATSAQEMQPGESNSPNTQMISGLLVDASCAHTGPVEKADHALGMNRNSIAANVDRATDPTAGTFTAGTTDRGLTGTNVGSNVPPTSRDLTQPGRVRNDASPMPATDGQGQTSARATVREMDRPTAYMSRNSASEKTMNGVSSPTDVAPGSATVAGSAPARLTTSDKASDQTMNGVSTPTDMAPHSTMASASTQERLSSTCPATAATTRFAIMSAGRAYSLDAASNSTLLDTIRTNAKFQDALNRNDTATQHLTVTAKARMDGDTVHLFSIRRGQ